MIGGYIPEHIGRTLITNGVSSLDTRFGQLQYEVTHGNDHCYIAVHINPNASNRDDADVFEEIKSDIWTFMKDSNFVQNFQNKYPKVAEHIKNLIMQDSNDKGKEKLSEEDSGNGGGRIKEGKLKRSKKGGKPKKSKHEKSKRTKSSKQSKEKIFD